MSGNRAWLRKLRMDSPYPLSDEIVGAIRDIIIDVLISRDLLDYADVPITVFAKSADPADSTQFVEAVVHYIETRESLKPTFGRCGWAFLTSVTEEAARRTDPDDQLYDKHIRTARKNGEHTRSAVYRYIDEYVEEFLCHWFFAGEYGKKYTPDQYRHLYCSDSALPELQDKESLRTLIGSIGRLEAHTTSNKQLGGMINP